MPGQIGPIARKTPLLPAAALLRPTARLPFRTRSAALMPSPGSGGRTGAAGGSPTPVSGAGSGRSSRVGDNSVKHKESLRPGRGRVRFASPRFNATYEVTPYEEFYGMHPNAFNFDAKGNMVGLSPLGYGSPVPALLSPQCASSPPAGGLFECSPPGAPSPTPRQLWGSTQGGSPVPQSVLRLTARASPPVSPGAPTPRCWQGSRFLGAPTPRGGGAACVGFPEATSPQCCVGSPTPRAPVPSGGLEVGGDMNSGGHGCGSTSPCNEGALGQLATCVATGAGFRLNVHPPPQRL
eukprot:CAMPEP_0203865342 /NCGR_PEP_ID=MMETSP0359-20131031/15303_1 /ASSEMBLY_ACC=CAM_ASM_000338 /TAXON_ID=268821 /ORGANISM="Scrippsiella Hangoei, Strain SHTV-5" /LENGTH=293 /DNA_ID=CAMNT_0050783251 /DNA_START=54 /DNA_END=935 /DNA_ORIENTATION=-